MMNVKDNILTIIIQLKQIIVHWTSTPALAYAISNIVISAFRYFGTASGDVSN